MKPITGCLVLRKRASDAGILACEDCEAPFGVGEPELADAMLDHPDEERFVCSLCHGKRRSAERRAQWLREVRLDARRARRR